MKVSREKVVRALIKKYANTLRDDDFALQAEIIGDMEFNKRINKCAW